MLGVETLHAKMISWGLALSVSLVAAAVQAEPAVDMVWQIDRPVARVGEVVEIGLYLVPDDGLPRDVVGFDAILGWDPLVLELLGVTVENGNWLLGSFPNDGGLDRLNADCATDTFCPTYTGLPFNDGDAFYQAFAPSGNTVPGEGWRVATFSFLALSELPDTRLTLIPEVGLSETRVLDGDPNTQGRYITGTLGVLAFDVAACGTRGDFDANCRVEVVDHGGLAACLQGPANATLVGPCSIGDMDDSGTVDLRDVQWFQRLFDGP